MLFQTNQCKYQKPHQKTNRNICFFSLGDKVDHRQLSVASMYNTIDIKQHVNSQLYSILVHALCFLPSWSVCRSQPLSNALFQKTLKEFWLSLLHMFVFYQTQKWKSVCLVDIDDVGPSPLLVLGTAVQYVEPFPLKLVKPHDEAVNSAESNR